MTFGALSPFRLPFSPPRFARLPVAQYCFLFGAFGRSDALNDRLRSPSDVCHPFMSACCECECVLETLIVMPPTETYSQTTMTIHLI